MIILLFTIGNSRGISSELCKAEVVNEQPVQIIISSIGVF